MGSALYYTLRSNRSTASSSTTFDEHCTTYILYLILSGQPHLPRHQPSMDSVLNLLYEYTTTCWTASSWATFEGLGTNLTGSICKLQSVTTYSTARSSSATFDEHSIIHMNWIATSHAFDVLSAIYILYLVRAGQPYHWYRLLLVLSMDSESAPYVHFR